MWLNKNNSIDEKLMNVMLAAVSDRSLTIAQPAKDILRANTLKNMLAALH
jgi:transcriptional regulator CtsR